MDLGVPFGPQLRRRRVAAGLSLAEFARQTHYSKGYLSKIETGARSPNAAVARRCDAALDAGGTLMALVPAPDRADSRPLPSAAPDQEEVWALSMGTDGSVWLQPRDRREALTVGAASLLAFGFDSAQFPSRVQPDAVLGTWSEMFGQLRALGQRASPHIVLPTLMASTHTLQQVAANASGELRSNCYVLASRYAEYAGWMAQETGQDNAALWWTDKAVGLASAGGDQELAAYALVRRALVSLYAGDARQTIDLARRAQHDQRAGHRVRGLAAQREAQGHALAGAYSECHRALERADVLLDRAAGGSGPVLGSSTVTNPVSLSTAWCLYDLGRPAQAAELLDRQLEVVDPSACRFRARWGARRALAYAACGEIDHACALSHELLADLADVDSATVRSDVHALGRILATRLSHPPVRRLVPELTAILHRPSARSH
ncbi:MAG: helix-turn-helix domain-containing protein [Pseudonocardiaceae bacterium]